MPPRSPLGRFLPTGRPPPEESDRSYCPLRNFRYKVHHTGQRTHTLDGEQFPRGEVGKRRKTMVKTGLKPGNRSDPAVRRCIFRPRSRVLMPTKSYGHWSFGGACKAAWRRSVRGATVQGGRVAVTCDTQGITLLAGHNKLLRCSRPSRYLHI